MQVDYLIAGQGIAGAALSYHLMKSGARVLVVGNPDSPASSKVAAGLVNPLTGKKLAKTWQADILFPYLRDFYQQLEQELGAAFFHPTPIYRLFTSVQEQNTWIPRTALPEYQLFTRLVPGRLYTSWLENPHGGMEITGGGYVEVALLLNAYQQWLQQQDCFQAGQLAAKDVELTRDGVQWQDVRARKVIFCEGRSGEPNPYFDWLPFRPVKGELLKVQIPGVQPDHIINRHEFILPAREKNTFRAGATYEWNQLDWQPTGTARNELITRLNALLKVPFTILDQQAGIRPATADRRPFVGLHPEYPQLGIFNGMGTKGISLAPLLARDFVAHLQQGKELNPEVHILRYLSLYYVNMK